MLKKLSLYIYILCLPHFLWSQGQIPRLNQLDIQHYRFALNLSDETDEIRGEAQIRIKFLQALSSFHLDLVAHQETDNKGMRVSSIKDGDAELSFRHEGEQLHIELSNPSRAGEERLLTIQYRGIPADGLIIGTNKYEHRTFFGDNWPNRAHHWLPTVDHPSDKATVEFIVSAPEHYQVIGNGLQVEETNVARGTKLTHWREVVPLPTKVMVIGVADFAVQRAGEVQGIPISSWVYPEDRTAGFYDYAQAMKVLPFFIEQVGPYPYRKLANVQSKTRYGGMENASSIFYYENSVTGEQEQEALIAHEIAHQWFGNSASEGNWFHVWLSEGFATYFTHLYFEQEYGVETARERLREDREKIINFAANNTSPIINTQVADYNELLNTNAYQKGGWVLHMLRREIGDEAFWKGVRQYYAQFQNSNALSKDLQKIMEQVSGQRLDAFFQQWLYRGGLPLLAVRWEPTGNKNKIRIVVQQLQEGKAFQFPLDLLVQSQNGSEKRISIVVSKKDQSEVIKIKGPVSELVLDPEDWLLFENKSITPASK